MVCLELGMFANEEPTLYKTPRGYPEMVLTNMSGIGQRTTHKRSPISTILCRGRSEFGYELDLPATLEHGN